MPSLTQAASRWAYHSRSTSPLVTGQLLLSFSNDPPVFANASQIGAAVNATIVTHSRTYISALVPVSSCWLLATIRISRTLGRAAITNFVLLCTKIEA
jgi:hypothetical protein